MSDEIGKLFIATEADCARIWRVDAVEGINPFTKAHVSMKGLRLDDGALARLPSMDVSEIEYRTIAAFFGRGADVERITPDEVLPTLLFRIPDAKVKSLVERAPSRNVLYREWRENLKAGGKDIAATGPYAEHVKSSYEETAAALYDLAKKAVATNASIYGYWNI